jgi:glycosyltransferase involved in cell wall biosynthesis
VHILHAIHDFPPRHQAGSEIYALELARAQAARHHVTILCAEYDPARDHGHVTWRVYQELPVVEIVNNWRCDSFEDTYRSRVITARLRQLLAMLRPDVLHVHNLLNLSFELPAIAKQLGIPVAATLHDYTLVCASGGQRVHRRDRYVCHEIDTARCARCFTESPFHAQTTFARVATAGVAARMLARGVATARRIAPQLLSRAAQAARHIGPAVTQADIETRMTAARRVFQDVDVFVAPSPALGREFAALGLPADRLVVSDYGMATRPQVPRSAGSQQLRIGFVGTLVWHKGAHVMLEAVRLLPPNRFTLTLFGNTTTFPDYTAELKAMAAGLPVTFAGGFAPAQSPEIYSQIDVLVVPSLWPENSPLVIHEAFMAGIPVVGARMGGIVDVVTDQVNGLLYDASSPAALAAALRQLIDDPARVAAMGSAAPPIKTVEQDAREWDAVYERLRHTREAGAE